MLQWSHFERGGRHDFNHILCAPSDRHHHIYSHFWLDCRVAFFDENDTVPQRLRGHTDCKSGVARQFALARRGEVHIRGMLENAIAGQPSRAIFEQIILRSSAGVAVFQK